MNIYALPKALTFGFGIVLFFVPNFVYAHAFGARYDLPLPLSFFIVASGIAVAVSFLVAFLFVRRGDVRAFSITFLIKKKVLNYLHRLLQLLGLVVLSIVLMTALVGDPSPTKNLATVTVWVWWWVGFTLFSALLVNLWPCLNPFCTLAALWIKIVQYLLGGRSLKMRPLPVFAPYLAVLGLFTLSWIELVSNISETPRQVFWLIVIYLVTTCLCASRYGFEQWFKQADPLTRLFSMMGRLAPFSLSHSSGLVIRFPGSGLSQAPKMEAKDGLAAVLFILMLISVVLFDGLSETPLWQWVKEFVAQSQALRPALLSMQSNGLDILMLVQTAGLILVFLLACITYYVIIFLIWLAGYREVSVLVIACQFAPSLLPIAIAYHLAHYVSYFMLAGQLIIPILSDPFALGWDLWGTQSQRINLSVINAENVWWIAVFALIAGHVIAVFVAHAEAIRLFTKHRIAVRSQIPMMVFMVLLTMLSLWVLSQPIIS